MQARQARAGARRGSDQTPGPTGGIIPRKPPSGMHRQTGDRDTKMTDPAPPPADPFAVAPETAPNPWAVPPPEAAPPGGAFGGPRRFGPVQGLIVVAGFLLLQVGIGAGAVFARALSTGFVHGLRVAAAHRPLGVLDLPPPPAAFIAGTAIAAYALAALWAWYYVLRRARPLLAEGGPEGIGWARAGAGAYPAAVAVALGCVGAAALVFRIIPVPPHPPGQSAFDALLAPGPMLVPAMFLVVLGAPLAEEFIFRGAAFAAFAARWGAGWAVAVTTALFVAVHAPEKLAYPPGFLDVSLMALGACWLRLRYRSIRPAVVLHVLYNFGVVLAAVLLH